MTNFKTFPQFILDSLQNSLQLTKLAHICHIKQKKNN